MDDCCLLYYEFVKTPFGKEETGNNYNYTYNWLARKNSMFVFVVETFLSCPFFIFSQFEYSLARFVNNNNTESWWLKSSPSLVARKLRRTGEKDRKEMNAFLFPRPGLMSLFQRPSRDHHIYLLATPYHRRAYKTKHTQICPRSQQQQQQLAVSDQQKMMDA